MKPDYVLQGKVVVLTGASGGIGRALALAFARQRVRLCLVDRDSAALEILANELTTWAECHAIACDLGDDEQVAQLAQRLQQMGGVVNVLVNNAGVEYPTPLTSDAPAAVNRWAALLDNNVVSMVRLTRALLPMMSAGTSVINQSSIWGKSAVADFSAYVASKHAVIGLTRSLAWELGPRGIRVNAVCPGWIRTEAAMRSLASMAQQQGSSLDAVERDLLSRQAIPAMLTPEDIAGVYLFLASADAAPLTGQSLVASNGEVMG